MPATFARVGFAFASLLLCFGAHAAGAFRVYLSSAGSDSNPCTVTAPCRLLGAGLDAVADGGEIWMLDSANFSSGTVNITKSVSILAVPGQVGSIVAVAGSPAVVIIGAGIKVALRNVVIANNTTNPGTGGIEIQSAGAVSVEDALFANLSSNAIHAVGNASLNVRNSTFRDINGLGVFIQDGIDATIANSHFIDTNGLESNGSTNTTTTLNVSDSTVTKGAGYGIAAIASGGFARARAFVTRCTVEGQNSGVYANNAASGDWAYVTVSSSTLSGNNLGMSAAGTGAINSTGNNQVFGNATDVGSGVTTVAMQ